ncbi:MAG: DNA primase, partial [Dechloromonas sp.]|nr:DNA primase [Dechloromonas sp.]
FPDYNADELKVAGLIIENEAGRRYDRFRDRLMIPIVNPKGEIIAFGGRIIDQGEPKYLNSPETPLFEKGRELFGLPQARQALRETNTAIVTEGYMDVIALSQNGVGNAVATLGTATTPTHVQKLLRQVDRIVFSFDGDNAGRKAAWRALENALEALADNKQIGFVFLPAEHDPDSFIREFGKPEFDRMVAQAMPLSDFLLRELAQRCDLTSSEGKARLIYEAKPLLLKLPTPLLRLQLVKRLAEASGFAQPEVERLCELKSYTPAPPARAKRTAPSLTRNLLRIVLHKPQLARQLPIALLPDTPERPALTRLHQLVSASAEAVSYAALREQLRGLPEENVIEHAASELLGLPFDEEGADAEFRDTLEKLQEGDEKRAFDELQRKAQQFGVAGLSAAEKQAYIQFLTTKANRS